MTEQTASKFEHILTNTATVEPVILRAQQSVEQIVSDFATFKSSADDILNIALNNSKNSELVSAASEQQANAMEQMRESSMHLTNVAAQLNDATKKFTI